MKANLKTMESGDSVLTNRPKGKTRPTPLFDVRGTHSAFRLKKILVPIDFSENSKKALGYAQPFAEEFGASIVLLNVIEPMMRPEGRMIVPAALESRRVSRMDQREARLDNLRQQEIGNRIKADMVVQMGEPYKEIINMAKAKKVDLIIVGTHGYSGVKHLLLGSTAERVVRHAPCPVLVVREREHDFV